MKQGIGVSVLFTAQNYGILWCIESGNCLFFLWDKMWDNNLHALEFYLATVYFNKK